MTHECQRSNLVETALRSSSSTPSCCCRATLAGIVATPLFLGHTPPSHPVCESSIAIVWRRGGPHRGTPTCLLTGATLSMNPAAPLLFRHTPSSLPIRESISTIVWVCRGGWHCWHHWWQDWHHWWQDRSWWWRCGRATAMVDSATPRFFVSCPSSFCIHSAIEWVHWTRRYWSSRWHCAWWCWRRRRWWRRRWRRERSGWNGPWWLWQSWGGSWSGASLAHSTAAEILLCLGPCCFPHRESCITIVWQ